MVSGLHRVQRGGMDLITYIPTSIPGCCLWYAVPAIVILYTMHVTKALKYISQWWFARTMNLLLPIYNRAVVDYKRELFSLLGNENTEAITVLEIGAGSGGSLDFYPKNQPIKLIAVEPNIYCQSFLEKNLSKHENIILEKYIVAHAENMRTVESNSIDAVISTIVMCSVEDQSAVLQEVKRVLKPNGRFYFMEHVAAKPDTWMCSIQNVLNFTWNILFDGCNINRNTSLALDNAGFSKVVYKHFMANKLGPLFYVIYPHIAGYAEK